MPRGDMTGPVSQGPMTGRRLGFCAQDTNPQNIPQNERPINGLARGGIPRGMGMQFGLGRRRGRRFLR